MVSQKKLSLKQCIKCDILLTEENWAKYSQKVSHYICNPCRQKQEKIRYLTDQNYSKKQLNRYHQRRSIVIHAYGDFCVQCGEDDYYKLTMDHINNNGYLHRKLLKNHVIDWFFNNPVNKDGYQILCYNCNCSKNVIYKDKYALRDKKKVMENYGNQCAECKEDRIERLTIDHKNNDGAEQRKKLKCYTGSRMYRWIIKQNYPDNLGLQTLCFNCNCSKISKRRYHNLTGVNA